MLWIVDVDADHTGTQDWGSRKASPFLQWIAFLKGLANSWLTASQLMLKEERNQHRSRAPEMRCKNRKCGLWVPSIWECWDSREICEEGRWKVGHVSTAPTQRPSKAGSTLTEDDACVAAPGLTARGLRPRASENKGWLPCLSVCFLPSFYPRAAITSTVSLMPEISLLGVKAFYITVNAKDIFLGKCILCEVQLKIKIRYFSVLKWDRIDQLR